MYPLQSTKHLVHPPKKGIRSYHFNFVSGPMMVNFFRHERFEKYVSWSADVIPFDDRTSDVEFIEGKFVVSGRGRHEDFLNTGKAEISALVRAGVCSASTNPIWLNNNKSILNKMEYEPFYRNTEAVYHKWSHSNIFKAELYTFRTWPSGMASQVRFTKAPKNWQFYLELGKSFAEIKGIPYIVKYDSKNGLIILYAKEQKLYFSVGMDKNPVRVECGYGTQLPSLSWLLNKSLNGVKSVDFEQVKDKKTLCAGGAIFKFDGVSKFGIYLACSGTEQGSIKIVNKMRKIGIKDLHKEHLDYWRDIHDRMSVTSNKMISNNYVHQQVPHIISTSTIRHDDYNCMGMVGPPRYYDYSNTRDEGVLIRVFDSLGLFDISRKYLNDWQALYINKHHTETSPLNYIFRYNGVPGTIQSVEVCSTRIETIHHHWFLSGDTKWLREKGYPLAKWFGEAVAKQIDSKTGLICAETEGDYRNFEGNFMFLVQVLGYLAFRVLSEMAEGLDKFEEADYWNKLAYNLKQSILHNYPADADSVFWFNINKKTGRYEKRVEIFTVAYLIFSGLLSPGDIRLAANVASLDYCRFQMRYGIYFYYAISNHWYDPAFMAVLQGFPIGAMYARIGRTDRTKEILKLCRYIVRKDKYKTFIERPYIEDLVVNTGIHGELMRYLYEDQPYWKDGQPAHLTGPFQWGTAGPIYILSTECFSVLPSKNYKNIDYFHFNPVIAPYRIQGKGINAHTTENEVWCNGKRLLKTYNPLGRIEISYKLKRFKLFTRELPCRICLWIGNPIDFKCTVSKYELDPKNKTIIIDTSPFTEIKGSWR